MLRVTCEIDIESEKWDGESQKQEFMQNAEDVILRSCNSWQ